MVPPPPPPLPPPGDLPRAFENTNNAGEKLSGFIIFMNVVNTLTHLILGAVSFSAIYFANFFVGPSSFKQHIYLCVIGYIILMSQSILTLNPYAGWARLLKQQDKKLIHWVMQVIGSILAIVGSLIRIIDNESNFESAHGILGLVAMILTVVSLVGGLINLFSSRLGTNTVIIKLLHSCFGSLTLCTAFVCLCFAFHHDVFRFFFGDVNAVLCIALAVLGLVGTLLSAFINMFRRVLSS